MDAQARCRCSVLNNLAGDVASDYTIKHLDPLRTDAMGRAVHRCPDTGVHWTEERSGQGYGADVIRLRRATV